MQYLAHKTESEIQTIKEHSENVAKLAESFAITPLKEIIYNIGLLHDIGKYQVSFQKRIGGNTNIKIPHAICGAKEVANIYGKVDIFLIIMQYCIAGHHTGLQDYGTAADTETTLRGNLAKETEDFSQYRSDITCTDIDKKTLQSLLISSCRDNNDVKTVCENLDFIIRYCFSCLTDADSLDTEEFCTGEKRKILSSNFEKTLIELDNMFSSFKIVTDLQRARSLIQNMAYGKIGDKNKIFLLNMPTGSGKTLCSLKFALSRALITQKKRIIYVIPYNSIIDQTAEIFENSFEDLNILRHQSSFTYEDDTNEDYKIWALKTTENWDTDFVITTAVQFFESVYGNKRGKLRKLHNMADSIIIFDEAHLMPIKYLEPCLKSIVNITNFLNSDALLLTATMPNFEKILKDKFKLNVNITDLIDDKALFINFKKCNYKLAIFPNIESLVLDSDEVSKLIIVNSKKLAKELYSKCIGEVYHLSTYMTGIDRIATINKIKSRIKKLEEDFGDVSRVPEDRKITVVSTSLIEAGVDLDFHTVYRELSGLDSVLQSGGRCNREGKRTNGEVVVFELEDRKGTYTDEQMFTRSMFNVFSDIDSEECIEAYYDKLIHRKRDEISKHGVYEPGRKPYEISFKSYAESFRLIDDRAVSVVIPIDEFCRTIMEKARISEHVNSREIQKYTVSVALWEFEDLLKQGVVSDFGTGVFFLTNQDYYNSDTGINFVGKDYYVGGSDSNGIWI